MPCGRPRRSSTRIHPLSRWRRACGACVNKCRLYLHPRPTLFLACRFSHFVVALRRSSRILTHFVVSRTRSVSFLAHSLAHALCRFSLTHFVVSCTFSHFVLLVAISSFLFTCSLCTTHKHLVTCSCLFFVHCIQHAVSPPA